MLITSLIVITLVFLGVLVYLLFLRKRERAKEGEEEERVPKDLLKKVRKLDLKTRKKVQDVFAGEYHSVFKGKGIEFSEVREYQIGDDIRSIDWNVTARMNHPFVKTFEEERELAVMLMVDMSSSGEFGTVNKMKEEIAEEICALLAFSAVKNDDKVGMIMFTDTIEKFVPPRKGRKHVLRILRELVFYQPEKKETDIANALEYLNKVTNRQSIVFLLSDFLSEDFETPLNITSHKHDLVPIIITDPREQELPEVGLIGLEDAETAETVLVDSSDVDANEYFKEKAKQERKKRDKIFNSIGLDRIEIFTDEEYEEKLISFFERRASRY